MNIQPNETKAIIIAAGTSKRLRPLTDNLPKCMLVINGKPILHQAIDKFRDNKINDISVIRGYKKEKIQLQGLTYFENTDYLNNNILHSLMCARAKIEEAIRNGNDIVITYADITFENAVLEKLLQSKEPITAVVDTCWYEYYEGRTDHPITEAENVIFDENLCIQKIGKNVFPQQGVKECQGEFIGMWKFTPEGAKKFLQHFDRLNAMLKKTEPYQNAKEWQKSYITDIFQEMIDNGEKIHCILIQKGWKEFDTVQDFVRAGGMLQK